MPEFSAALILEWSGVILAIVGAWWHSSGAHLARRAYTVWVASSAILLVYALRTEQYGILLLQGVFFWINLRGLRHWRGEQVAL